MTLKLLPFNKVSALKIYIIECCGFVSPLFRMCHQKVEYTRMTINVTNAAMLLALIFETSVIYMLVITTIEVTTTSIAKSLEHTVALFPIIIILAIRI
jgi:hypothetical protein